MALTACHFEIHVHSLHAAQAFYVDTLGLEVLQSMPEIKLLAVKAGAVRLSIFEDAKAADIEAACLSGGHVIFRTDDLIKTITALQSKGVSVGGVSEAPGFMRYIQLHDPSGNVIEIAQYLRDPLMA